jgi:hypothetical protein
MTWQKYPKAVPLRRPLAVVTEHDLRQAARVVFDQSPPLATLLQYRPTAVGQPAQHTPMLDRQARQRPDERANRAAV